MQALYGYYTTKESLKKVVRDHLEEEFTANPLTHDMSDTEEIDGHRKIAMRLFDRNLEAKKVEPDTSIPDIVFHEVTDSMDSYYKQVKSEGVSIKKTMISETKDLQDEYYKFLMLPGEFQFIEKQDKDRQEVASIKSNTPWRFNLQENPLIEEINTHSELQRRITEKKLSWESEVDSLKTWYKTILKKDERFIEYQQNSAPTLEDHQAILMYFFKKFLFKNDLIQNYFEQENMRWTEDSNILKSMLTKTIQDYHSESEDLFELKAISLNEEDDFEFFETIYSETIKHDDYLEGLLSQKTKNWDLSRLAQTDLIILKMAVAEMIHCRSIPVKVTINEFIEVCKLYSTPKSKQFVNGVLDVLANQLTSKGVIKKSGRGLIDNK